MDLSDRSRTLLLVRLLAASLTAAPFLVLGLLAVLGPREVTQALVVPAGVLGLVAPAVGWRVQSRILEGARSGAEAGRRAYLGSVLAGLSITEGTSLLGVVAWFLSEEPSALVGLAMHLVLAFALWPTEERMERAEEAASP